MDRRGVARRELLAGVGGLGVLGGGGGLLYASTGPAAEGVEPVAVETIDAPGSADGTTTVPDRGRPTVLEFFATSCADCRAKMTTLRAVHDSVEDVQFVSVTIQPVGTTISEGDVADWWREHGGNWTVGIDPGLELARALDVQAVPATVVFDEERRAVHSRIGETSEATLREWIETV